MSISESGLPKGYFITVLAEIASTLIDRGERFNPYDPRHSAIVGEAVLYLLFATVPRDALAGWESVVRSRQDGTLSPGDLTAAQWIAGWRESGGLPYRARAADGFELKKLTDSLHKTVQEAFTIARGPTNLTGAVNHNPNLDDVQRSISRLTQAEQRLPFAQDLWDWMRLASMAFTLPEEIHESYLVAGRRVLEQSDPGGTRPDKTGCYIATAIYGSYDAAEVMTLRRFRDERLELTFAGRVFIRGYYAVSPLLVRRFGHIQWIRYHVKKILDYLVAYLSRRATLLEWSFHAAEGSNQESMRNRDR